MPPGDSGTSAKSVRRPTAKLALFGPPAAHRGGAQRCLRRSSRPRLRSREPDRFFEEIWIGEIVDLVSEATRLRRLKVSLLNAPAHDSLVTVLAPLADESVSDVVNDWAWRETNAVKWVNDVLESADLSKTR
jgi:hypothetical protein